MAGATIERWLPQGYTNAPVYSARTELVHTLMKVETHNHPTAISPFAGASTGADGETRDEGATGRGGFSCWPKHCLPHAQTLQRC
jgi:phosphoribosylformylglycinamidine synthase